MSSFLKSYASAGLETVAPQSYLITERGVVHAEPAPVDELLDDAEHNDGEQDDAVTPPKAMILLRCGVTASRLSICAEQASHCLFTERCVPA